MRQTFRFLLGLFCLAPTAPLGAATPGATVTVYNDNLALIVENRTLQLARGTGEYTYEGVTAQIEPTSVQLRSLTDPEGVRLLEQRFSFDLAGTERLLRKYLDQPIVVTVEEGETVRGRLLSESAGDAILRLEDGSVKVIRGKAVNTYQFPSLPEGLVTRPTLVWLLDCKQPGKHDAEIRYLTHGLQWQADYTAVVSAGDDELALSAWASIENRSGAGFENARIRLVAGDVHRVGPQPTPRRGPMLAEAKMMAGRDAGGFQEAELFEYHLYELGRRASLPDQQVKQLPLFAPVNVKARKEYRYDGARDKDNVHVTLLLDNTKHDGLGAPLPAGKVRVYKLDASGDPAFTGEDRIDHVPEGEEVELYVGNAFDLVGERAVIETRQVGKRSRQETVEITLRNRKKEQAEIIVVEHMRGAWEFVGKTPPVRKKQAERVEFEIKVPKKGEEVFQYQVLYSW